MQTKVNFNKPEENVARRTDKITLAMILDAQGAQIVGLNQRISALEGRVKELERRLSTSKEGAMPLATSNY